MPNEPQNLQDWTKLLAGIDIDLPEGGQMAPPNEIESEEHFSEEPQDNTVFLQKIITEVWIYTDIEGKTFGHTGLQDIMILGEMKHSEAMDLIGQKKQRKRRRKSD